MGTASLLEGHYTDCNEAWEFTLRAFTPRALTWMAEYA